MTWKKSGTIYDGDWKDDRRCGFGTYSVSEGGGYRKVYSGGWKNDKRHVCVCNFSWFFFFSTIQVKLYADTRFLAVIFTCYVIL